LVIPCHNEVQNVGRLLDEIAALSLNVDTLVVDDGSTDQTSQVAKARTACLRFSTNRGVGAAVQAGVRLAQERDYDLVIQVDGDGQHPPSQLPKLIDEYHQTGASLIVGSRFLSSPSRQFRSTRIRRLGIRAISNAIKTLYERDFTDPTSGFRLMDRRAMQLFSQHYPYDFPEPVSIGIALQSGLQVHEVPIRMRPRRAGQTYIRGLTSVLYVGKVVGALCAIRIGFQQSGTSESVTVPLQDVC